MRNQRQHKLITVVIGPILALIIFALLALSIYTAIAKAEGTGGAQAPPFNANVTITIDVMQDGLIGSVATMYDGTTFVDCDNCGEIGVYFRGKKVYFKLLMTNTERFVRGSYVYQQVNRRGKFVWSGKSLMTNDWKGGRLKDKIKVRINRHKVKMRLVSVTAQVHDSTKLEIPVKNGDCDPKAMECMK